MKTKYREIKTKIPSAESEAAFESMKKYEVKDMYEHELPIIWDKADDFQISDKWGNTWIDFTSGIFVANVGHAAKEVKQAIEEKLQAGLLHSYIFPNDSRIQLTKKICEVSNMDKVLLTVTGSEANEAAIQTMRNNKKGKILTLKGANYGSTTGCREIIKDGIDESMSPDTFNPDEVSGVFLEAFRGKDAKFVPYDWVQTWCTWAEKNNIPVGFDEMQSGFARTGKWFGHEHYNVKPDFITVGKAFGGGLPISALVGKEKFMQHADDLWSTHTANPVSCAAALAVLDIIEGKKLVEKTQERDKWVRELLQQSLPNNEIHGRGMIWGIYTGDPEITQKIIQRCAEKGVLLVSTHGPAVKVGPPLTIPDEALREGIEVIKEAVEETEKET
jgi:4-aminobutyrate aminotransferase / (S)-3-amino-2-methylpropionate transaminase / 5-aminovalerate transaminase